MISDINEINSAIEYVLSQPMYIRLSRESIKRCCPNPDLAIHVTARSADEAVILSEIELAQLTDKSISGSVLFIKSLALTMGKLQHLLALFTKEGDSDRGLCYQKPDEGEVEIWLFVSLNKSI